MKWFFCLNDYGVNSGYLEHLKVALKTMPAKLEPILIYDGDKIPYVKAKIIHHELSIHEIINAKHYENEYFGREFLDSNNAKKQLALGAYLRVDVPLFCDDEYALYTDVDVMFNGQLENIENIKPKYFAVAPEFEKDRWDYFNSGIMVMNVKAMLDSREKFIQYIKDQTYLGTSVDQYMFNMFYQGLWERLPIEYNWKPYWGVNPDAEIIHFHGAKPRMFNSSVIKPLEDNDGFRHYTQVFEDVLRRSKFLKMF